MFEYIVLSETDISRINFLKAMIRKHPNLFHELVSIVERHPNNSEEIKYELLKLRNDFILK